MIRRELDCLADPVPALGSEHLPLPGAVVVPESYGAPVPKMGPDGDYGMRWSEARCPVPMEHRTMRPPRGLRAASPVDKVSTGPCLSFGDEMGGLGGGELDDQVTVTSDKSPRHARTRRHPHHRDRSRP
jgi:hypothetical protein